MSGYQVLKKVTLSARNTPTGATKHYSRGREVSVPVALKITRYPDTEGYYLMHFDLDGTELTDTFHGTIEEAVSQADWEFGIKATDWEDVSDVH